MGLHFSKEEFSLRKSKVIQSMKDQNIDALLMFRQESMYWLTGYDTFGYVFFQTLVLDQKGNIILLTRAPDLRQAQNTSYIDDIRIWIDKDGSNPTEDLKIILNELDLKGKKIGIEYEAYGLTGRNAIQLNASLNNFANLHDKSELVSCFRAVKSNNFDPVCLLNKSSRRETDINIKWSGFDIPDEFVVGYGIDYAQNNNNDGHFNKSLYCSCDWFILSWSYSHITCHFIYL